MNNENITVHGTPQLAEAREFIKAVQQSLHPAPGNIGR